MLVPCVRCLLLTANKYEHELLFAQGLITLVNNPMEPVGLKKVSYEIQVENGMLESTIPVRSQLLELQE